DEYLREYHRVGSCPQQDQHAELRALEMNLSPFAYSIVSGEFKYAISLNKCDCVLQQTMLLPCRHIIFPRMENICGNLLPPYDVIASRWMRGCPVNDIALGDAGEGGMNLQTMEKVIKLKVLQSDDKYIAAKVSMEEILSVLTIQRTPTFRAALSFLEEFSSALRDGKFAEFSAGFPQREVAIVKMETSATTMATSGHQVEGEKPSQSLMQPVQFPGTIIHPVGLPEKKQPASKSNFTFSPPPKESWSIKKNNEGRLSELPKSVKLT
ncbi:hypothetical protein PHMEG_00031617, partial [Phytophthora megakarya]